MAEDYTDPADLLRAEELLKPLRDLVEKLSADNDEIFDAYDAVCVELNITEARLARAEKVIEQAPHDPTCYYWVISGNRTCDCWKADYNAQKAASDDKNGDTK